MPLEIKSIAPMDRSPEQGWFQPTVERFSFHDSNDLGAQIAPRWQQ